MIVIYIKNIECKRRRHFLRRRFFSALLIIKELTKAMLYIIFKSADVDPKSDQIPS